MLIHPLGRTRIALPALGLGCAPLGELNRIFSEVEADAILETAWDGGLRYFDTAPWYGRGLSELRLGRLLRRQRRSDFVLSTKVGRTMHRAPEGYVPGFWKGGLRFQEKFDYSYDGIMRSYEQSQMRLGLDRVDMLLIHDLDVAEIGSQDLVEAHFSTLESSGWRALDQLRRSGEVAAVGAGVNIIGTIPQMLARFDLDFFLVAMPYTLAAQPALDGEFQLCEERGVGVVIGSPFASGILATGATVPAPKFNYVPAEPAMIAHVARIEAICDRLGIALPAAALQFPLRHPIVASVIAGAEEVGHVRSNIAWALLDIPEMLWDEIRAAGLLHSEAP